MIRVVVFCRLSKPILTLINVLNILDTYVMTSSPMTFINKHLKQKAPVHFIYGQYNDYHAINNLIQIHVHTYIYKTGLFNYIFQSIPLSTITIDKLAMYLSYTYYVYIYLPPFKAKFQNPHVSLLDSFIS